MKTFLVLLSIVMSATCFAQGGGDRIGGGDMAPLILAVHFPSNPLMVTPRIRTVEIYANGRVVERVITSPRTDAQKVSTRELAILSDEKLERASICSSEFSSQDFEAEPSDYCMDDSGTHYLGAFKQKEFAVRYCGQLQSIRSTCADEMVKLLDRLSR